MSDDQKKGPGPAYYAFWPHIIICMISLGLVVLFRICVHADDYFDLGYFSYWVRDIYIWFFLPLSFFGSLCIIRLWINRARRDWRLLVVYAGGFYFIAGIYLLIFLYEIYF